MIDAVALQKLALTPKLEIVAAIAPLLEELMPGAAIDTAMRRAHFLAQICYESGGFTRLEENLRYTHVEVLRRVFPKLVNQSLYVFEPEKLADQVYAGRYGNGDPSSGDGWRFRGRGLLQHTFRDNYAELAAALSIDLVGRPDRLSEPDTAVRAALFYWGSRDCNVAADQDNVCAVTKRINGGTNGLADRAILKHRALTLGI